MSAILSGRKKEGKCERLELEIIGRVRKYPRMSDGDGPGLDRVGGGSEFSFDSSHPRGTYWRIFWLVDLVTRNAYFSGRDKLDYVNRIGMGVRVYVYVQLFCCEYSYPKRLIIAFEEKHGVCDITTPVLDDENNARECVSVCRLET